MTRQVSVREWPEELLIDVDVLVCGTPCQAFSLAGQSRGRDDERRSPNSDLAGRKAGPKETEVTE
jgi:site-specific DNA-cytosine methylase